MKFAKFGQEEPISDNDVSSTSDPSTRSHRSGSSLSSIANELPSFLAEMKAANDALEANIAAGNHEEHLLEIHDDVYIKREEEEERPYIEMNLGLGVLEEMNNDGSDEDTAESDDDKDAAEKSVSLRSCELVVHFE